jgi:hypothetical protein
MSNEKEAKKILYAVLPDDLKKIVFAEVKTNLKNVLKKFTEHCTEEEFLIFADLVDEKALEIKKRLEDLKKECETCVGQEYLLKKDTSETAQKICSDCINFNRWVYKESL